MMDYYVTCLTLSCVLIATVIVYYYRQFHRFIVAIAKIPGPAGGPFAGLKWRLFAKRENVTKHARSMVQPYADKYPLIKLWAGPIPIILLLRAEAAKVLLNSTKEIEKSIFYRYLYNWIGTGLLTSTGNKWQQRRKLITPSFHFRILENFLLVMNEQADILVKILKEKCEESKGREFDIYPYVARCALDIICETAMGQGVKAQLNADSEYVNAVNNLSYVIKTRMMRPYLAVDWIFRLSSLYKLEKKSLEIVHGFSNKIIKMKREKWLTSKKNKEEEAQEDEFGRKRRVALLDMLLENAESNVALSNEDIREEVDTFMFEGHDTTSVGMGWALYCIGQLPEVQQKIVDELKDVLGDSDGEITSEDLHKLKYLECVMKEVMRMFPPVPSYGRTIREEMEICGYKIPANVNVFVTAYYVHRDPKYYPNPDDFQPERFLADKSTERDPFAYIPFSAGLRNCIGQKFAVMEEKVVLGQILRNFKVTSIKEEDIFSNVVSELVLRPIRGIRVKLEPRAN